MKTLTRLAAVCLVLGIVGMAWGDLIPRPRPRPYPTPYPYPVPVPIPVPQPPRYLPAPDPLPQREIVPEFWTPKDIKFASMPMVILIDDKAQDARLEIPSAVFSFRAALDVGDPVELRAEADNLPTGHTIMAGVALSLAFCTGGVWLVRRGRHVGVKGLALVLTVGASVAIFATVLWAQGLAPRHVGGPDRGEPVNVEIKAKNDGQIKLVLTRKQLARLVEQAK